MNRNNNLLCEHEVVCHYLHCLLTVRTSDNGSYLQVRFFSHSTQGTYWTYRTYKIEIPVAQKAPDSQKMDHA